MKIFENLDGRTVFLKDKNRYGTIVQSIPEDDENERKKGSWNCAQYMIEISSEWKVVCLAEAIELADDGSITATLSITSVKSDCGHFKKKQ